MSKKYYDGIDALKELVGRGQKGCWTENNGCHVFRSQRGGVLSYWPGTFSISVQGKSPGKDELEALIDEDGDPLAPAAAPATAAAEMPNKKVFVVYGHDKPSRTQLDAMLRRWGLEPVILDELPSKGQTIIEKLEDYTEDVGFGVVLATPDDLGFPKDHEDQKAYRARQNVVLRVGNAASKTWPAKSCDLARLAGSNGTPVRYSGAYLYSVQG